MQYTFQRLLEMDNTSTNHCRFCGSSRMKKRSISCSEKECMWLAELVCNKTLKCGHSCVGILCETKCMPCPKKCRKSRFPKECSICMSDILSIQSIQLSCGHIFHLECVRGMLKSGWHGPRINFTFILCPKCKTEMDHPILDHIVAPLRELMRDVEQKAVTRLAFDGIHIDQDYSKEFAMNKYAYYQCHKCKKAYFGGEEHCQERVMDEYNPEELVCPQCSDQGRNQICLWHGTEHIVFKCRYCCSLAVYYCFGTTHFCRRCHDNPGLLISMMEKHRLPRCPAGPQGKQLRGHICPLQIDHPPTGEEFPLGCGLCQNLKSF